MGCWGITAFQSDTGLDAVGFIRAHLPDDGKLDLGTLIESLKQDKWNAPSDVQNGDSHTSPMALAEIIVNFLDQNADSMDYDEEWANADKKFSTLISFAASKESLQWIRDYLSDTLCHARKNADFDAGRNETWGGWFQKEDWIAWQSHMETLINRMDSLLAAPDHSVELVQQSEPQVQMNQEM